VPAGAGFMVIGFVDVQETIATINININIKADSKFFIMRS